MCVYTVAVIPVSMVQRQYRPLLCYVPCNTTNGPGMLANPALFAVAMECIRSSRADKCCSNGDGTPTYIHVRSSYMYLLHSRIHVTIASLTPSLPYQCCTECLHVDPAGRRRAGHSPDVPVVSESPGRLLGRRWSSQRPRGSPRGGEERDQEAANDQPCTPVPATSRLGRFRCCQDGKSVHCNYVDTCVV